ncbi:MAG: hypothetical protein MPK75_07600, partial [Alphaproteobacteria bacterium]|nr:hypothetical protein [Alphaproteobacteria bacterium]
RARAAAKREVCIAGVGFGCWIRRILDGRRSWCQLRAEGQAWPGGFIDGARISVILAFLV